MTGYGNNSGLRGGSSLDRGEVATTLAIGLSISEAPQLRDPDVRLMLQVRDDDAPAFEELMLRYQHRVVTLLEHLVGHRESAEDLAQEVFLRVYRARKTYAPSAKFCTWLFTIVNNVASPNAELAARPGEAAVPRRRLEGANGGERRKRPDEHKYDLASGPKLRIAKSIHTRSHSRRTKPGGVGWMCRSRDAN